MWRTTKKVHFPKSLTSQIKNTHPRVQSTQSTSKGSGGKTLITLVGTAVLGVGGSIAYAKYDPSFKKVLEDNIPYADTILKSIPDLGNVPSEKKKDTDVVSSSGIQKAAESGLLKKKQEREIKKEEVLTPEQTAVAKSPALKYTSNPTIKKVEDEESLKQKQQQQQASEAAAANLALEKSVREASEKAEKLAKEAIASQRSALDAIKDHTQKLYKALDANEENERKLWADANDAGENKTSSLLVASQVTLEAKSAIEKLKQVMAKGKESSTTAKNVSLLPAEVLSNRIIRDMQLVETELDKAQAEFKVVNEYKDLVDRGKEQFQKELNAIMPDVRFGEKGSKLTEEELNFLIAHAHRRVQQLQRQLAKQQITEQQRIQQALQRQNTDSEKTVDSRLSVELSKQQREMESDFQKKLVAVQEDFEYELRQQLRRQAAAHSDHLQEVLTVQQEQLGREHQLRTEEKLLELRGKFHSELSASMARLQGIDQYLKAREELDKDANKAQQLWLACQSMKRTIKVGTPESNNSESRPLTKEIASLKQAGLDNAYINIILSSIPEIAVSRGVYTEETLKQRFQKVDKVCRRVALIDQNGGSLYLYLLSYLQSFFLIDVKEISKYELEDTVRVNPKDWNTFDILSRVQHFIQHDNLEQALRYANQLRGEPRNVARDWIKEVRLLLETRQAVDALIAHAAAVGIQAYH